MQLQEGLKEHDLVDLVLPLISMDEYESKLDEDAIVIGFYIQDQEPAQDLNRFIQKSAVELLDTDVSPAPNEDGYFMVFVEFMRDNTFIKKIQHLVRTLEGLTAIAPEQWKFKPYGHDSVFEFDEKNLKVLIRLESLDDVIAAANEERLYEFFKPSSIDALNIQGNVLEITRLNQQHNLTVMGFGAPDQLVESLGLQGQAFDLVESARRDNNWWRNMLGEGWQVTSMGGYRVFAHEHCENILITQ